MDTLSGQFYFMEMNTRLQVLNLFIYLQFVSNRNGYETSVFCAESHSSSNGSLPSILITYVYIHDDGDD